jgi:hypothetical protein
MKHLDFAVIAAFDELSEVDPQACAGGAHDETQGGSGFTLAVPRVKLNVPFHDIGSI